MATRNQNQSSQKYHTYHASIIHKKKIENNLLLNQRLVALFEFFCSRNLPFQYLFVGISHQNLDQIVMVQQNFKNQRILGPKHESEQHNFYHKELDFCKFSAHLVIFKDIYCDSSRVPYIRVPYSHENKQCLFKTHAVFGCPYFRAFSKFILYFGQFQCIQGMFMAQIYL